MSEYSDPGPCWVDPAWWEVYGPRIRDRQPDQAWIDALAKAWCLIRTREALTPGRAREQDDWTDRLLGRKFYPTQPKSVDPLKFDGLIRNIQAIPIAQTLGLTCPACDGQLEDRLGPFWCPACQAPVSSWVVFVDILAGADPVARPDDRAQRAAELESRGFPGYPLPWPAPDIDQPWGPAVRRFDDAWWAGQ